MRTLALADHYRFVSEGLNDGAGFSLARTGDRDGDGNPDVAIGAPFHSFGGLAHRGAVYLVASGDLRAADRSDGREDGGIFLHNVAGLPNSWKLLGAHADGNAGWSVSRIDDLDGDGSFDIAVGAPNGTMGAAYLLATADLEQADAEDGATDGVVDLGNAATGQHSWIITGVPGDAVGSVIVAGGDTDGDGTDELLLLARNERTGTSDIGALYVVDTDDLAAADRADGDADRVVRTRHLAAGPGSWRFAGGNLSGPVGGVAAYAGDSDADGRDDVLIGSPRASPGGRVAGGAAYLAAAADFETADARGTRDGTIRLDDIAAQAASWRFIGEKGYDAAGESVAGAGDIDGDGRGDLIVGAPGHSPGGAFLGGAAYLIAASGLAGADADDGNTDGSIDLSAVAAQADSYKFVGENLQGAGVSLFSAGDPDGDGVADLLIGSQGQAAWLIAVTDLPDADAADGEVDGIVQLAHVAGQANSYQLALGSGRLHPTATSLASVGDIDGDQAPDLLLGISGGAREGVYLVSRRNLADLDAADGTSDAVLHLETIGPRTMPLPPLTLEVSEAPTDVRRGLGKARARIAWRARSPWQSHPAVDYAVTTDDDRIVVGTTQGTLAIGATAETSLEADCIGPGRITGTVTITAENVAANVPWSIRCTSGNDADLIVELHQGPMAWQWDSLSDTTTTHVSAIAGRRAAVVAHVLADAAPLPELVVTVRDDAGATVAEGLPALVEPATSGPRASTWGLATSTHVLDLGGELYATGNELAFDLELDTADGTSRVSYAVTLTGWAPPTFDITFIPIRSPAGAPPEFDAADYMTGILDLFPIADAYQARVGDEHEYLGEGWSAVTAARELLHAWNEEGEAHEYYHGIFKYPWDGSTCGYAWIGTPVAVSGALNDGCTPNIYPHELGHNFGLPHAPGGCGAGNPDPNYPYADGGIGPRPGWLFSEAMFVNPDDRRFDTMTYCSPNFISDYNYEKVVDFRRGEAEVAAAPPIAAAPSIPTPDDGATPAVARSIALTGAVDAQGGWSLDYASLSERAPRPSHRGAFTLELQDANAGILHSEPIVVHAGKEETAWAWTARVPYTADVPARVVVRDPRGIVLDVTLTLGRRNAR